MLINAQSSRELRIAIVRDSQLEAYQVEVAESGLTRGNIYRGVISSLQPSLNAAFVDYGAEKHGFLTAGDVVDEARYKNPSGNGRPRIDEVLEAGRPVVVQVTRDPQGGKGAGLTTNLSIAGRFLVLTPFDSMLGVSRKVQDDEDRGALRELVGRLEMPEGCGAIVRTNARDQTFTALNRDLSALMRLWSRVQSEARRGQGAKLLYSDQDLILRALRDHLDSTVTEVLVDAPHAHEKAAEYMKHFMPRSKTNLELVEDRIPLFTRFSLEPQIDTIYRRKVDLPSGGSIVIDPTEALTAIDVNSGRSTGGATQGETAFKTNLEAAAEVGRQIRLRDIGGLLVVDFIDMRSRRHQRQVEKELRDAMKADKARFQLGKISPNGLLEINRQRIQQALSMRTHHDCPACRGAGRLPNIEMVGLNLMRRIAARAAGGQLEQIRVELHPEIADGIQNTRRNEIAALEAQFEVKIEIVSSWRMERVEEDIRWGYRRLEKAAPAATSRPQPSPSRVESKPDAESEGSEKRPARRRRRRRSRGNGTARGSDAERTGDAKSAQDATPPSQSAAPPPVERPAADGGNGSEAPKPRRRRPRRRGRRPSSEGAETVATVATES